jgi:hypothetical protein
VAGQHPLQQRLVRHLALVEKGANKKMLETR